MTKTLWGLVLLVVVLALGFNSTASPAIASPEPSPNSSKLGVRFQKGLLSMEVKEASWVKLLEELSRTIGIVFHINIRLEGSVTASFNDLPVERALEHLFGRDANFMFLYRNRHLKHALSSLPSEVWILGRGQEGISKTFGLQDTEAESTPSALEDTNDPAQEIVRKFESNPRAAREFAQRHPDPRVQRVAITYLGEQATAEAIEVLFLLLQDRESSVRQNALEALGPLVQHHRPVRENLVKILERSEESDTRQLIADSLGVSLDNIEPGQPIAMDVLDDVAN